MLNINFLQVAFMFTLSLSATALPEPKCGEGYISPWGYNSDNGPISWSNFTSIPGGVGELVAFCSVARSGTHQSPVVIRPSVMDKVEEKTYLTWDLTEEPKFEFEYDGHTVEATAPEGEDHVLKSILNGAFWDLKQFHFHTPSEHTYGAEAHDTPIRFPLEVHFVHLANGKNAVLGIWFRLDNDSPPNPFLEEVTKHMNQLNKCGDKTKEPVILSEETFGEVKKFVEAHGTTDKRKITTYEGSLTTPPCKEGVNWFIVQEPMTISSAQLERFQKVLKHNSRCTKSEWKREGWSIDVDGPLNNCKISYE